MKQDGFPYLHCGIVVRNGLITAFALLFLTACLDRPEISSARKFMQALIRRDVPAAQQVVVPERREPVEAAALVDFGLGVALQELTAGRGKLSYTGLTFQLLDGDLASALIGVNGSINVNIDRERLSLPFQFNLRMEKRNNRWLVSDILRATNGL